MKLSVIPRPLGIYIGGRAAAVAGPWGERVKEIPAGAVVPSPVDRNISDPEAVAAVLRELLEGLSGRRAVLALPDAAVRVLITDVEGGLSRVEMEKILRWQMERSFLYPIVGARFTWRILRRNGKKRRVAAAAVSGEIVSEYESLLSPHGIDPSRVTMAGLALYNRFEATIGSAAPSDSAYLFVRLSEETFSALGFLAGTPEFIRVKPLLPRGEAAADRLFDEISTSLVFGRERGATHLFLSLESPAEGLQQRVREELNLAPVLLSEPQGSLGAAAEIAAAVRG